MPLQDELGLRTALQYLGGEAVLNVVHTASLLVKEGDRVFKPLGLTDSWFNVLMLIRYQSENGRINQSKLGRMLLVNRSNVTGLVDRMERAGLVRRVDDPADRRVNMVEMTDKGHETLKQAYDIYHGRIEQALAGLDDSERRALIRLLESVREGLSRRPAGTG